MRCPRCHSAVTSGVSTCIGTIRGRHTTGPTQVDDFMANKHQCAACHTMSWGWSWLGYTSDPRAVARV